VVTLLMTAALPLCGACASSADTSRTHAFTVAAAGMVQITLTSVEPLTTMALGVAVTTGGNAATTTSPGPPTPGLAPRRSAEPLRSAATAFASSTRATFRRRPQSPTPWK
jgi:hypothetical protein